MKVLNFNFLTAQNKMQKDNHAQQNYASPGLKTLQADTFTFSGRVNRISFGKSTPANTNWDKKTLDDLSRDDIEGKRILVRVEMNVPTDKKTGDIKDSTRIEASIPTIKKLVDMGGKVVLTTHLGRPGGKIDEDSRLNKVAEKLESILRDNDFTGTFEKLDESIGTEVQQRVNTMSNGDVILLENIRFHKDEEAKDGDKGDAFAQQLAALGDVFVNDAFGTAHRAQGSTARVAKFIEGPCVAGTLMDKEIKAFQKVLDSPEHPFISIVGGSKADTKVALIENLAQQSDQVIIVGGLANAFLKAQGKDMGASAFCDDEFVNIAKRLLANDSEGKIVLPVDAVVAESMDVKAPSEIQVVPFDNGIPADKSALDIGPQSSDKFDGILKRAKTILWNGPAGVFENKLFNQGTNRLAKSIADATNNGATTVIGGGDTVSAISASGHFFDEYTHVSTGGGASLELAEGKILPGIGCLDDKD